MEVGPLMDPTPLSATKKDHQQLEREVEDYLAENNISSLPINILLQVQWIESGTILILLYCFVFLIEKTKQYNNIKNSILLYCFVNCLNYQVGVGTLSLAIWVRIVLHVNVPKWTYTFLNLSFKIYINTYYFLYMIRF